MNIASSPSLSMIQSGSSENEQDMSARQTRITEPVVAKRLHFYKSGDPQFSGLKMVISNRSFKTFDALLDNLSKKVPLPFGVRNISTPRGIHSITKLDDLEDGKSYICSQKKKVKPINLEQASKKPIPWYSSRPMSARRRVAQLARQNKIGALQQYTNVAIKSPRRLVVFKNGDPAIKHIIILNKKTAHSFDALLDYITEVMQFPVTKLYTQDGRRVDGMQALILCSGVVVAASREPFKNANYDFLGPTLPAKLPGISNRVYPKPSRKESKNQALEKRSKYVSCLLKSPPSDKCDVNDNDSLQTFCQVPAQLTNQACYEDDSPVIYSDEDDIIKSVHVNQDGSMTIEMKVRFKIEEEETIQWSTTVSRNAISNNTGNMCNSDLNADLHPAKASNTSCLESTDILGTIDNIHKEENNLSLNVNKDMEIETTESNNCQYDIQQIPLTTSSTDITKAENVTKSKFHRPPTPGPRWIQRKKPSIKYSARASDCEVKRNMVGQLPCIEQIEKRENKDNYSLVSCCTATQLTCSNTDLPNVACSNIHSLVSQADNGIIQVSEATAMQSYLENSSSKMIDTLLEDKAHPAETETLECSINTVSQSTYNQLNSNTSPGSLKYVENKQLLSNLSNSCETSLALDCDTNADECNIEHPLSHMNDPKHREGNTINATEQFHAESARSETHYETDPSLKCFPTCQENIVQLENKDYAYSKSAARDKSYFSLAKCKNKKEQKDLKFSNVLTSNVNPINLLNSDDQLKENSAKSRNAAGANHHNTEHTSDIIQPFSSSDSTAALAEKVGNVSKHPGSSKKNNSASLNSLGDLTVSKYEQGISELPEICCNGNLSVKKEYQNYSHITEDTQPHNSVSSILNCISESELTNAVPQECHSVYNRSTQSESLTSVKTTDLAIEAGDLNVCYLNEKDQHLSLNASVTNSKEIKGIGTVKISETNIPDMNRHKIPLMLHLSPEGDSDQNCRVPLHEQCMQRNSQDIQAMNEAPENATRIMNEDNTKRNDSFPESSFIVGTNMPVNKSKSLFGCSDSEKAMVIFSSRETAELSHEGAWVDTNKSASCKVSDSDSKHTFSKKKQENGSVRPSSARPTEHHSLSETYFVTNKSNDTKQKAEVSIQTDNEASEDIALQTHQGCQTSKALLYHVQSTINNLRMRTHEKCLKKSFSVPESTEHVCTKLKTSSKILLSLLAAVNVSVIATHTKKQNAVTDYDNNNERQLCLMQVSEAASRDYKSDINLPNGQGAATTSLSVELSPMNDSEFFTTAAPQDSKISCTMVEIVDPHILPSEPAHIIQQDKENKQIVMEKLNGCENDVVKASDMSEVISDTAISYTDTCAMNVTDYHIHEKMKKNAHYVKTKHPAGSSHTFYKDTVKSAKKSSDEPHPDVLDCADSLQEAKINANGMQESSPKAEGNCLNLDNATAEDNDIVSDSSGEINGISSSYTGYTTSSSVLSSNYSNEKSLEDSSDCELGRNSTEGSIDKVINREDISKPCRLQSSTFTSSGVCHSIWNIEAKSNVKDKHLPAKQIDNMVKEYTLFNGISPALQNQFQNGTNSAYIQNSSDSSTASDYRCQTSDIKSTGSNNGIKMEDTLYNTGYVKRTIEKLYGKQEANSLHSFPRIPSASKINKNTHRSASSAEEMSAFYNAQLDQKCGIKDEVTHTENIRAVAIYESQETVKQEKNLSVNLNDNIPVHKGRWLVKENHLIRRSLESSGMYGCLETSTDTVFDNTSEDVPYSHIENKAPQHSAYADISSSEIEDMAKPVTPKCSYFSMPHGSESEPFSDGLSTFIKGKHISNGIVLQNPEKRNDDMSANTSMTLKRSKDAGSNVSSVATLEFRVADNKVHPENIPVGEGSILQQPSSVIATNKQHSQDQDSLDKIHAICGQHCPILAVTIRPLNEESRWFVYQKPSDIENQIFFLNNKSITTIKQSDYSNLFVRFAIVRKTNIKSNPNFINLISNDILNRLYSSIIQNKTETVWFEQLNLDGASFQWNRFKAHSTKEFVRYAKSALISMKTRDANNNIKELDENNNLICNGETETEWTR